MQHDMKGIPMIDMSAEWVSPHAVAASVGFTGPGLLARALKTGRVGCYRFAQRAWLFRREEWEKWKPELLAEAPQRKSKPRDTRKTEKLERIAA